MALSDTHPASGVDTGSVVDRSSTAQASAKGPSLQTSSSGPPSPRPGSASRTVEAMTAPETDSHTPQHAEFAPALTILGWSPERARDFHDINAAWIQEMFELEAHDREVLEDPQTHILDRGGEILFVSHAELGVIGACALMPTEDGAVELTKMGVVAAQRGLKAGEFLLRAVIARAVERGCSPLFLLTNRKCEAAIHLYEKLGFAHDAELLARYGAMYARCNVAMRYRG